MKRLLLIFFFIAFVQLSFGQILPGQRPLRTNTNENNREKPKGNTNENIDSIRARLNAKKDSVIYTSKFIKFTKEEFLRDSVRLFPLDTTTTNFQRYRVIDKPENPTMNLGLNGLAYRDLLFQPTKTIGFDVGYHYYDRYLMVPEDIVYYQARSPYTELYYQNPMGRNAEQQFHVIHSQNVKPNWNIGASFYKLGSRAFYGSPYRQADSLMVNHLNGALWTWYSSKNKRYTLIANATFNNLKSRDNGSIFNDSIFTVNTKVSPEYEQVRLNSAKHNWRNNSIYIKQFYNIGKQRNIDASDSTSAVLPTQRVSYKLLYNTQKYFFTDNGRVDVGSGLLNNYYIYRDSSKTSDSTLVTHFQNEFNYSFYLRGKSVSFLRNELKVNAGIQHDFYKYQQYNFNANFQNVTLKGDADYGFSDKASLNFKIQQIIQGKNAGDFLYEATSEIKLGNKIGSVILNAYSQNQSPAFIYERQISNHYAWNLNFDRQKTQHLGFAYVIPKYSFQAKAEYFLISNYHYFVAGTNGDAYPAEFGSNINLLKFSIKKDFHFGRFTFQNFITYQKTDFKDVLRTPELYSFQSFFVHFDFFKKVLKADFGFDVRYYTKYAAPSYAPAIGQFYNANNTRYDSYPILDLWARTNWKRANLFIRYDYANQGWFSKGYYTVNQYPMPYKLAKFGISWRFYD